MLCLQSQDKFYLFVFYAVMSPLQRYVGHVITTTIMLSIFILVFMIDILFVLMVGDIWIFRLVLFLFLLNLILYDFWDAMRNTELGAIL